ncbi:MAG: catechol 2,3-dioxygenase [Kineosporiaceae bacterium]|nr:catechol 2,3-dioxygenase [Kineosporiaceae bacterium]
MPLHGVTRLGYVHARVTNLDAAKAHYGQTLGLYPMHETEDRLYFKGWDEWDHHSVVLEAGGVGLVKLGYKVNDPADIDVIERNAQNFGVTIERMSSGDNLETGDGIRMITPSEHVIEIYHSMTRVGTEVGFHNPEVFPRHLVGVGAPRIEHALITADDVNLMDAFFHDVLGFYATERVVESLDDGAMMIGTWMAAGNNVHDIAVIKGPQGKLHHFAFHLADWSEIKRAGQLFAMDDVPIDVGPTQHGITRGETIYFFDPSGNRNEVFAGGYVAYPDRGTVNWTPEALGKGIFYIQRELNERFTTVLT